MVEAKVIEQILRAWGEAITVCRGPSSKRGPRRGKEDGGGEEKLIEVDTLKLSHLPIQLICVFNFNIEDNVHLIVLVIALCSSL